MDGIKVKSDGSLFFFEIENEERRNKILEVDPIIIRGKIFIITK